MATWHQERNPVKLYHETDWTVVIDPPGEPRALYTTSTKLLAEVYLRNLRVNNPRVAQYAYILKPEKSK